MDMPSPIIVGLPTFQRPQGLRKLLFSLAAQQAPFPFEILVADNEGPDGAGHATVAALKAEGFPIPIHVIAVAERGIAQARNALLREGFGNLNASALSMVDDDERVEANWIAGLVAMQAQTGADVIAGKVLPEFESGAPPAWSYGLKAFWYARDRAPGPVDMVYVTTSILLNRSVWENFPGELFDIGFSLTGGSDEEFFTRLKRRGATFAYAADAISHEFFTASRTNKRWALQRSYRIGSCTMRVFRRYPHSAGEWLRQLAILFAALLAAPLMYLIGIYSPAKRMQALALLVRQWGKLAALCNHHPAVYKVSHGS